MSVESPNALLTLQEMASMSDLSGLTDDKFKEEAEKFCKLSENILKVSKVKHLAEFLYFDGKYLLCTNIYSCVQGPMSEHLNIAYLSILLWYITALSILKMCRNQLFCLLNASDFQSNFSGSNTFGIMKISSRQG